MPNDVIVRKERSQYLIKAQVDGSERIVVNGTQVITPEGIADYVNRTAGKALTPEQEAHLNGSVRFDEPQSLTDEQKRTARKNIGAITKSPRVIVHRAIPRDARVGDIYFFADGEIKIRKQWEGKGYMRVVFNSTSCWIKIDADFHKDTSDWYDDIQSDHEIDFRNYLRNRMVLADHENYHTASPNFDIVDSRVVCVKSLPQIPNKFTVRRTGGAHRPFPEYAIPHDVLIINKRARADFYSSLRARKTRGERIAYHRTRRTSLRGGIVSWVHARTRKGYTNPVGIKIICAKRTGTIVGIRV